MTVADKIIETADRMVHMVTENELARLRLKEELLTTAVMCEKHSLATKQSLLSSIGVINRRQLEMLGHTLGGEK